jgi:hypothetical protein
MRLRQKTKKASLSRALVNGVSTQFKEWLAGIGWLDDC